jgi:glutamate:GABA antiporter
MKNKKTLSVFSLVMINIIAVDSIRALPVSAEYGLSLIFFYLVCAIGFMIPVALIAAECASAWPEEGGIYIWTREAFGKSYGLFVAWIQWIYNIVWFPSILSLLAMILFYIIDPSLTNNKPMLIFAINGLFWLVTLLNCFGIRIASWLSIVSAIIGTLLPIMLFVVLGICWIVMKKPLAISLNASALLPHITHFNQLGLLSGVVFGLIGLDMSAVHASDVSNPQRDYPRALLISVIVILTTMILGSLAISLVIPAKDLNLASGIIESFQIYLTAYHLSWLTPIIAVCILIGGLGGVSAWILGPGRCMMVASRDQLAPAILNRTNRYGAPVGVLLIQAVVFSLFSSVYLLFPDFNTAYWLLSVITSQLAMMLYMVVFLAAIRLRFSAPKQPRGFIIPGGRVGITLVGGLGFITCLVIFSLGLIPPAQLLIHPVVLYETVLIACIIILTAIPIWISRRSS